MDKVELENYGDAELYVRIFSSYEIIFFNLFICTNSITKNRTQIQREA